MATPTVSIGKNRKVKQRHSLLPMRAAQVTPIIRMLKGSYCNFPLLREARISLNPKP